MQGRDLTELTLEERGSAVKEDEDWWDEIKPRTLSAVNVLVEELHASKYRRTELKGATATGTGTGVC